MIFDEAPLRWDVIGVVPSILQGTPWLTLLSCYKCLVVVPLEMASST